MKLRPTNFTKSDQYWERAQGLIPAGTQTLSKGPTQFVQGVTPKYLQRGQGSHVWDVDGNEYIDYPMALGPIILGHAHPVVNAAVIEQIQQGSTFTHMHPVEVEVAEIMRDLIPCLDMVRYGKNGSDATTGAVRCARAYTGRSKIASCGFHGWHDWNIADTSRRQGIPNWNAQQIMRFKYNDIESLNKIFKDNPGEIALVIMEAAVFESPRNNFLAEVKELAHQHGAVLCFDEIITGFRWALGGASEYFGVEPDIATFGKAMSNGYPVSAIGGKAEFMKVFDEIFMSGTYGGEVMSLAAAKATLTFMRDNPVIEHLWRLGERIQAGYNRHVEAMGLGSITKSIGMGPRTFIQFNDPSGKIPMLHLKSLFQQEVVKGGILFNGNHSITYSHTEEDIDYTLEVYRDALEVLARALDSQQDILEFLDGAAITPIF
jgi:glutamate-1-semialdehyde aminotransferase